jgi:D-proline reductase (dithiol) PrdB
LLSTAARLKNRFISKIIGYFPLAGRIFTASYTPLASKDIPWTTVRKSLRDCRVAVVTTAGVHRKDQAPFNMKDRNGDPSFRAIDSTKPSSDLMITHDYYDHSDADRDINIVFPLERLREFREERIIGGLSNFHYGFMGHILGPHVSTLMNETAPEVARKLTREKVDIVLLTPG